MKARSNRNGIIVFVLIIPRPLEHLTEFEHGRRRLVLALIDPARKDVDQLLAIAMMDKSRKGERLFPKQVNHVLEVIGSLFTKEHVLGEWIGFVASFTLEICQHIRHGKLRFSQSGRDAKGKYRVDEPMRVSNANITFPAETANLIGVVWDDMYFLDQLYVGNAAGEIGVDPGKSAAEELIGSLS